MLQVTLQWMGANNWYNKYKYFIFLNSSVRGPFYPSYLPPSWQWTQAFTDRLVGDIKLVGSSLVCLPEIDAGGPGPKVKSPYFSHFQPLHCMHVQRPVTQGNLACTPFHANEGLHGKCK